MKIYLMRHGDANYNFEKQERTLTNFGKEQVELVAKKLKSRNVLVNKFYVSGLIRSYETASIVKDTLSSNSLIEEMSDFLPESDPDIMIEKINKIENNSFLVGHQPFLSGLLYSLTSREENYYTAMVVCCEFKSNKWVASWIEKFE